MRSWCTPKHLLEQCRLSCCTDMSDPTSPTATSTSLSMKPLRRHYHFAFRFVAKPFLTFAHRHVMFMSRHVMSCNIMSRHWLGCLKVWIPLPAPASCDVHLLLAHFGRIEAEAASPMICRAASQLALELDAYVCRYIAAAKAPRVIATTSAAPTAAIEVARVCFGASCLFVGV